MELTKAFGKCVRSVTGGALPDRVQMVMLEETVMRYPWFTTARLLYSHGSRTDDPALKLHMMAYPHPDFMLQRISPEELGIGIFAEDAPEPEDAIDKFLSRGGYRIVPDERATDEDAAAGSARFDLTDDVVSEELAAIYAAQGLNRQAKEIYQRLSLLNPEKSVYFASIINKITVDKY